MKHQRIVLAIICLLITAAAPAVFAATTLHKLGKSPFHKPSLTSRADLVAMVQAEGAAIEQGFAKAGYPELYTSFTEQVHNAAPEDIEISQGERLEWMLYRKNGQGKVRVAKDVTWAGEHPFTAFRLYLRQNEHRYEIIIPHICGNIALRSITEAAVPPPQPVANQEPQCRMTVSQQPLFCGDQITVDASGSSDNDGSISTVTIAMVDDEGKTIEEKTITSQPFSGTLTVPCGGTYHVETRVTDDQGAETTSPACRQDVSARQRIVPVAAVGFMHLVDPGNFATMRGGLEYWVNDNVSVMGMLGYSIHIDGNQGDDALSADLLGLYHIDDYYIGGGIGWWNMDDESYDRYQREILDGSNLDLILQAGKKVYGEDEGFTVSVFAEARAFADSLDELEVGTRFTGGLLFHF